MYTYCTLGLIERNEKYHNGVALVAICYAPMFFIALIKCGVGLMGACLFPKLVISRCNTYQR